MNATTCVPEPELAAFVVGKLSPERLEAIAGHVDHCPGCQDTVAALAERSEFGSFPGSAWERAAMEALASRRTLQPVSRQSLSRSAFPGRAWERVQEPGNECNECRAWERV